MVIRKNMKNKILFIIMLLFAVYTYPQVTYTDIINRKTKGNIDEYLSKDSALLKVGDYILIGEPKQIHDNGNFTYNTISYKYIVSYNRIINTNNNNNKNATIIIKNQRMMIERMVTHSLFFFSKHKNYIIMYLVSDNKKHYIITDLEMALQYKEIIPIWERFVIIRIF